ncbi:hypothetical protein [Alkalicoccus urumqiensis]|uniref:hypothetical protein n=1 Tax=Alkalicoccus urumqiensis TaxID=1548213 RepID=UPI0015E5A508|nr:hypothetical protein [Alkalicoccus urumqiensis]
MFISICEKEEVRVAMMTHSRFKVPVLERMRFDGDVSEREFDMMKSCMLINRHTRSAFETEVYRQIHREDFIDVNNGKEG